MTKLKRILIVDDDPLCLEPLRNMLEACNYLITLCENSQDAQRQIETGRFDALLTDYNMAGQSGLEIAALFRRHFPGGLIVGMSGFDMAAEFEAAGADHFLRKPILSHVIERLFRS